jgi:hypothetical protein
MMGVATRTHALRGALVAGLLALVLAGGFWFRYRLDEGRRAAHADALVSQLLVADINRVPEIIESLGGYRAWADPQLAQVAGDPSRPGSSGCTPASLCCRPIRASSRT